MQLLQQTTSSIFSSIKISNLPVNAIIAKDYRSNIQCYKISTTPLNSIIASQWVPIWYPHITNLNIRFDAVNHFTGDLGDLISKAIKMSINVSFSARHCIATESADWYLKIAIFWLHPYYEWEELRGELMLESKPPSRTAAFDQSPMMFVPPSRFGATSKVALSPELNSALSKLVCSFTEWKSTQ